MRNIASSVFGHVPLRTAAYLSILCAPLWVIAQTNATSTPSSDVLKLETYTVKGLRLGLQTGIDEKRKADVVMDTISSEDIGKFPDQNIAESLQRITGVMIERSRGEGSRVSVRGLDPKFNSVKFNGRTLTSSTGARDFNFLYLQPDFVGALEIIKSPSADLEEGALSATINIRTLRPLDINQRRIVANVEGSYEENAEKWNAQQTVIYSDTFLKGKLGVLVGLGQSNRQSETHQFQGFGFERVVESTANLDLNRNGVIDGTAVRFDHAVYFNTYQPDRDRTNAVTSLQFKPSDNLEFYLDGLYAKYDETYLGNDNALRFTNILPRGATAVKGSVIETVNGENYAVQYDLDGVDYRNNSRVYVTDERTYSLAAGFKWKGSDRLKVEGEVSHSDSRRLSSTLGLGVIGRASAGYDLRGNRAGLPVITFSRGYDPLNPNGFNAVGFGGQYEQPTQDQASDARLDAELDVNWGIFKSLEFGLKYSSREHFNGSSNLTVSAQKMAQLTGSVYSPTIEGGSFNAAPFMGLVTPGSTFLSAVPGHTAVQNQWLSFSPSKLFAKVSLKDILASTPLTQNKPAILTVNEDVAAAYVKGNFKGAVGSIPFSGNIGLRGVRTEQTSDGYAPDFSQIIFVQLGAQTVIPNSTYTLVERDYTNVLPSLNTVFHLRKDLDLRFSAARVMSRPDLGLLSTGTTVNANVLSISSNNPLLKPYEADQYDLSLEKYFGKGGLLTVAGFYKKIDSFVEQARTTETYNVKLDTGTGTVPLTFSSFRPSNGSGTSLQGVELGYQQQFTFLPKPFDGFGIVANYTYVDSGTITPVSGGAALQLTGVSKNNYNLIAYFENNRFSTRLAYNYRSGFLFDPASYFGDGESVNAFSTLDATLNVRINRMLSVTVNANNLTDEYQTRVSNYGFARLIEDTGRRFSVSLRATF